MSDITCQRRSRSLTFSTSRIHREEIQAQGHIGSNQKSAVGRSVVTALLGAWLVN
jgi:hypothetical protein